MIIYLVENLTLIGVVRQPPLTTDLHFTPGRGNIDKTVVELYIFYFIHNIYWCSPVLEDRKGEGGYQRKDLLLRVPEFC